MPGSTDQQLSKIYLKHCRFESLPAVSGQRCLCIQCFLQGAFGGGGVETEERKTKMKISWMKGNLPLFVCENLNQVLQHGIAHLSALFRISFFSLSSVVEHIACIRNETSHFLCG